MKCPLEKRSARAEIRAVDREGGRTIQGHAAVWGDLSDNLIMGLFRERIAKGAFADSIATDDVGCFVDHQTPMILGRTSAGTLAVEEDAVGLLFRCDLPMTSYASDLLESIRRGDIRGCSIGFYCLEERWDQAPDGMAIRTIVKAKLFDVSPCPIPAYSGTDVDLRSFEGWRKSREEADADGYVRYLRARLDVLSAI